MSWNEKFAGVLSQPDSLKAAVNAKSMPANVKSGICTAIDAYARQFKDEAGNDKRAIVVNTFGHVEADGTLPANSWNYQIKVHVDIVPLFDTPLVAETSATESSGNSERAPA